MKTTREIQIFLLTLLLTSIVWVFAFSVILGKVAGNYERKIKQQDSIILKLKQNEQIIREEQLRWDVQQL